MFFHQLLISECEYHSINLLLYRRYPPYVRHTHTQKKTKVFGVYWVKMKRVCQCIQNEGKSFQFYIHFTMNVPVGAIITIIYWKNTHTHFELN